MLQNQYNINLVREYLKQHSNPKNKELYLYCFATTQSQKQCVRRKKLELQKKIIPPGSTSKTTKLSADYLEKCLTEALAINPNNPNLLRTAIEFFIKIKGKTDKLDDDLDMEVLKAIGVKITASD